MKRGRLSILIPLLLILSSVTSSALLFWQEIRVANRSIQQAGIDNLHTTLTQLQNMLNTQLAADNLEDAKLSLSVSALHPGIRTLLLADENNTVMLANRYLWEGSQAAQVSAYSDLIAQQVRQTQASSVSPNASLLSGYYPVTLKIVAGGLGVNRIGVLFVEYDLAPQLAQARHNAVVQASSFGGLMIAVAIAVAMLLHWLVTRRVEKMVEVSKRFAAGDLDARVHLRGHDELAELGHAFDDMASQRKEAQEALRQAGIYNRSLIEASLDPLVTISAEGKITDVNQATEKVTGRSRSELIGTDFSDYFTEPDKAREGYQQVFAEGLRYRLSAGAAPPRWSCHRCVVQRQRLPRRGGRGVGGVRRRARHHRTQAGGSDTHAACRHRGILQRCDHRQNHRRHHHQLEQGRREDIWLYRR